MLQATAPLLQLISDATYCENILQNTELFVNVILSEKLKKENRLKNLPHVCPIKFRNFHS